MWDSIGLKKTLETLKTEHRILIELAYFKGYTHEEIAAMEEIPLGTVKNKNKNSIDSIKRILKVNIHDYISSGIVESYVLGLSDKEEAAEFERMCKEYPEVKGARDSL